MLLKTLKWAFVWGLAGAAMGVVATLIEPDTGHIARNLVPVMIGVPSAAFGAAAGLLFALVVTPAHISATLGLKGRVALGGVIGGAAGMIFMNLLAHSVITVLLATFLGAALAIRLTRRQSVADKKVPGQVEPRFYRTRWDVWWWVWKRMGAIGSGFPW